MQDKILLLIILAGFILRALYLDYPLSDIFWWGDGSRDFLVASHIVKYGEFPSTGPYNLLATVGINNSPVYFYVLAALLTPFNHPLTLSFFNIILQTISLILVYLIARIMFGRGAGLLASSIFAFNPQIIKQSEYIWQPYLMQPVALLALYLLLRGLKVRSYLTLLFAFLLHSSVFPWALVMLSKIFLVFSPVVLLLFPQLAIKSFSGYLNNFNFNLTYALDTFYLNYFFLALFLLFTRRKHFFIFLLFLAPIIFASFFEKLRPHYLTMSLPPLIIWVSALTNKPLLMLVIFIILTNNLGFLKIEKRPLENLRYIEKVTDQMIADVGFDSFQVHSLGLSDQVYDYPVLDTILLVPLEQKLNAKLTRVVDSGYNHVQTGKKDYIFLSCIKFGQSNFDCPSEFNKRYSGYQFYKNVYQDPRIQIYLLKM